MATTEAPFSSTRKVTTGELHVLQRRVAPSGWNWRKSLTQQRRRRAVQMLKKKKYMTLNVGPLNGVAGGKHSFIHADVNSNHTDGI